MSTCYLLFLTRFITPISLIFLFSAFINAQDTASYVNYKSEELLSLILKSSSQTERVVIGNYLANKYPTSVDAVYARAILAAHNEQTDEEINLYRKCLSSNQNFIPALFALGNRLEGKERIELHEKVLNLDASWKDYKSLEIIYFTYVKNLKDKSAADDFLAQWEKKLPNLYKFDLIRAIYTDHYEGDDKKAEQLYLQAIEKNPTNFDAYKHLLDMILAKLNPNESIEIFKTNFNRVLAYSNKNPNSSEAYLYLGDIKRSLGDYTPAHDFYVKAYENNKIAENAIRVYRAKLDRISAGDSASKVLEILREAYDFLLQANKELPNNQAILNILGNHASLKIGDKDLAINYYQQAIKYSYTTKDEIGNAIELAINVYEGQVFDFENATKIYLSYLNKGNKGDLLYKLFINRRNAQDFEGALNYLNDFERYYKDKQNNEIGENFFLDNRRQIEKYILAQKQVGDFYKENPFLQYWQNRFGDALKLIIRFAPGSSEIPQSDYQHLAEFAKLLRTQEGAKYIFSIEGHADNTETDKSISIRRAEAIRARLKDIHKIPLDRMQIVGYESNIPLASNATSDGRAKNRRVEILPSGRISKPTIFPTSALNVDQTIALSPDGRTIAVGRFPVQLWDIEKTIKLKDLGRGGEDLKFSPNGRYLATAINFPEVGGDKTVALLVYDIKTGLTIDQVPWSDEITEFDWDPSSQKIVFTTAAEESPVNKIIIRDIQKKQNLRLKISPGAIFNGGDLIVWSKDNKYIIAGRPWGKALQLYDPESLSLIKELKGVDYPHSLVQTTDGKYIVCADNNRKLSVWNTDDWSFRQMDVTTLTKQISVHPEKNIIVLNDIGFGGDNRKGDHHSVVIDLEKFSVIGKRDIGSKRVQNLFSADGSKIYFALKDKIEVIDAASQDLKTLSEINGPATRAIDSSTDTLNNYYISVDKSGVHIWNINTGKQIKAWDESVNIFIRMGNDKDNFLFTSEDKITKTTKVNLLNTSKLEKKQGLTLNYRVDKVVANSQVIAFAGKNFTLNSVGNYKGIIEVYDRNTLKRLKGIEIPLITSELDWDDLCDSGFSGFDISPTGDEAVVTSYWQDGFGHALTYSTMARIYNLNDEKDWDLFQFKGQLEVMDVAYNEGNANEIKIITKTQTAIVDKKPRKILKIDSFRDNEHKIPLGKVNGNIFWSRSYLRFASPTKPLKQLDFPDNLIAVEVFEDRNLLIILNSSNEISLYDLSRLEKVLTILPKTNMEWIAYSPSGYFVSSLNGADKVFWSLGDAYLEFSTLLNLYEKPGIISETLDSISKGQMATNKVPTGPGIDLYTPRYKLILLSQPNQETEKATYTMVIRVEPLMEDLPEPKIRFIQGTRDYGTEKATIRKEGNSWIVSREYELKNGDNFLQAALDYKQGLGLLTQTAIVTQKSNTQASNPNLWFLGIGVKKEPLKYPPDDVKCIANALKAQEGKLYTNVNIKTVIDEDAKDHRTIGPVMDGFLKKASSLDTVVIYVSGHGVLAENGTLFFVPHDGDLKQPFSNIPISFFGEYLSRRPPNQKALFLIDICHAGTFANNAANVQIKGGTSLDEALKQLARGSGLYVLAATSGAQVARESADYKGGHGAFAAAIIEALEGSVDKELSFTGSDFISVNTLVKYVSERVPKITDWTQHPSTPIVEGFKDYPFAKRLSFNACPVHNTQGNQLITRKEP